MILAKFLQWKDMSYRCLNTARGLSILLGLVDVEALLFSLSGLVHKCFPSD